MIRLNRLAAALTACALVLTAAAPALAAPAASLADARPAAFVSDRITVQVVGQGPDVVVIPGLGCPPAVWAELVARWSGSYRLHLVQLKGFAGAPAEVADGPVFEPAAQAVARYIREARLSRPAVIGHSLGGAMALRLAEAAPDSVGRVLIVDALPFFSLIYGPTATAESARPFADQALAQLTSATPEAFAKGQEAAATSLIKTPTRRAEMVAWSLASDRSTLARAVRDLMVTDLRPGLTEVSAPVTVLYAYDPEGPFPAAAVDGLYAGAYAGLKGAKLVRVDGARHFIMFDQPERFETEVGSFLGAK